MTLEEHLTEKEKEELRSVLSNPAALDRVIDKALKGWRAPKAWKRTKSA